MEQQNSKNLFYRIILHVINMKIGTLLSDPMYLKIAFRCSMRKQLNLKNSRTFNEKLQWLKLYNRKPEYTMMVDKYAVREYIANTIGEEYLIPLLGVWDNANDIDFDKLPNQFVLKCNHNSGLGMVICKDKSQLNVDQAKKDLQKGLEQQYYDYGREWPYKNVKPRIIAEKYMVDESGYELKDYKFFCFNGVPKLVQVDFAREKSHLKNLYDLHWNMLDFEFNVPCDKNKQIAMPENLKEMIRHATTLSQNIPYVRIDFYDVCGKVYFGEITFFPASGMGKFTPNEWDCTLGSWINLE